MVKLSKRKIMTVQEFNRIQSEKYQKAIDKWRHGMPFPSRAVYLYVNQRTGEPKKVGYVGLTKYGSVWARTKKEVRKKLRKVM